MGTGRASGDALPKDSVAIGRLVVRPACREAKMEIPGIIN
jgi:hypothetical protein